MAAGLAVGAAKMNLPLHAPGFLGLGEETPEVKAAKEAAAAAVKIADAADAANKAADLAYQPFESHLKDGTFLSATGPAEGEGGTTATSVVKAVANDWADDKAGGPVAIAAHKKALEAIGEGSKVGPPAVAATGAYADLEKAETALPTAEPLSDDVKAAKKAIAEAKGRLGAAAKKGGDRRKALGGQLSGFVSSMTTLGKAYDKEIKLWQALDAGGAGDPISKRFVEGGRYLSAYHDFLVEAAGGRALWIGAHKKIEESAEDLGKEIKGDDLTTEKLLLDDQAAFESLDGRYGPLLTRWAVTGMTLSENAATALRDFYSDPRANAESFEKARSKTEAFVAAFDATAPAWPGFAKRRGFKADHGATVGYGALEAATNPLRSRIADFQDARAGNADLFVSDQISLYYFTDVNRLMKALNPGVRSVAAPGTAGDDYELVRKQLRQREVEMRDAYDRIAGLTTRLINLTVDLENAKTALKTAKTRKDLYTSNLDTRTKEKAKTDEEVKRLTTTPPPSDFTPDKLEKAKARQKKAEDALTQAQADSDQANTEFNDAQTLVNTNLNEKNGLPAQIHDAEVAGTTASTLLKEKRNQLSSLAVDENKAFALARDNQPFLQADANAFSSDPAKRVYLYAYNDSKTLFIRGLPDDVAAVKDMIADFDRPTPQARITLWTLQMNVQSSRSGRSQLGNAMEKVEKRLSEMRRLTAMATSMLRDEINIEVQRSEFEHSREYMNTDGDRQRFARYEFYQREVQEELGFFKNYAKDQPSVFYFTRWILPDPAATTTLGEALMVMSLGSEDHRLAIANRFRKRLWTALKDDKYFDQEGLNLNCDEIFKRFFRVMNLDKPVGDGWPSNNPSGHPSHPGLQQSRPPAGMTAYQMEITRALKRAAMQRIADRAPDLIRMYHRFVCERRDTYESFRKILHFPFGNPKAREYVALEELYKGLYGPIGGVPNPLIDAVYFFAPALLWLREEFGVTEPLYSSLGDSMTQEQLDSPAFDAKVRRAIQKAYPKAQANARIAAADEMLKEMLIAVEDDVDEMFVQPSLKALRRDMRAPGLDVSVIERTSLLATNRAVGRVEPKASATLDLAGEQNLIEAAKQLSTVVKAVQTSNLPGILDSLNSLNKEPKSELYALFSGNEFKVTPIFDPSGQALRFQFDYVAQTDIRDPDGTKNPQLPRVDRHSVNAIVQLSNLELREISRFETDTKLGVPTKQWGGIPLLNQIPKLQELPIIGWFSRRNGQAAVSQHSMIFAQTAMYPPIGDISELLTGSVAIPPLVSGG